MNQPTPTNTGVSIKCETCGDGSLLPQYGTAPHDCYHKLGLSIGQSVVHEPTTWPYNFELDPESEGELGVWHCPKCGPKFKDGLPVQSQSV